MGDLVKRLRATGGKGQSGPIRAEAAERIEALEAENVKLIGALEPFAVSYKVARNCLGPHADAGHIKAVADLYVKAKDYRAARAALSGKGE